jgi:hypothetical protein
MALLANASILGLVDQNSADPGPKGRPAFEAIQALDYRHPGILNDLFSYFLIGHIAHGHSNERTMVLSDQFIERPLVTAPEPRKKRVSFLPGA